MLEDIRWCCPGLKGLFENFGRRGFGALFRRDLGINRFLLQYRAVDVGSERSIKASPDVAVSVAGQTGMRFCASCGVDLEQFYRQQMTVSRPAKNSEFSPEGVPANMVLQPSIGLPRFARAAARR